MRRPLATDYVAAPDALHARPTAAASDQAAQGNMSPIAELARLDLREQAAASEGGTGEAPPTPRKVVSRRALEYLRLAQQAIDHTRRVIEFQGNQLDAIRSSDGNAYYRTDVIRTRAWWKLTPEAQAIADADPEAAVAAKAEYLSGGNCFEYAAVAYTYLNSVAKGVAVQRAMYADVDHVFVVLGDICDPQEFPDNELVVADAWPYSPQACLWEDHFVYNPDRAGLEIKAARWGDHLGDGLANKALILAGLSLTPVGLEQATSSLTPELLADMEADQQGWGLWHQEDAAAETEFDYQNWEVDRLPMRPSKVSR